MKKILVALCVVAGSAFISVAAVAQKPTGAKAGQVPAVPKIKLFRSNPHRLTAIKFHDTDPYDAPDDEFISATQYRRPKIAQPNQDLDDELSDYVLVRLAVARARALERYRKIHS